MSSPHLIFVHGAWCGGWYWQAVAEQLRAGGMGVSLVNRLPSTSGDPALGLKADAAFLREMIEEIGAPVTLVGHSYGGMVITQLAGDPRVEGVIYLSAFVPKQGQSFVDAAGGKLARWIEVDESAGLSRIAEAAAAKVVTPGLESAEAQKVLSQLAAQSLLSFTEPSEGGSWGETPATYLVCTEDRVVPASVQHAMAADLPSAAIAEIDTGHFAMFTAVDDTVAAIASAARGNR